MKRAATLGGFEPLEGRALLAGIDIMRTTENRYFTIDIATGKETYGEYHSFKVTNDTGATLNDLWVKATDFPAGQNIQLGPGEDGLFFLGTLPDQGSATAFFYLTAQAITTVQQDYVIEVWSGPPPAVPGPGDTPLESEAFFFEGIVKAEQDDSGSITDTVSVAYTFGSETPSGPVVGGEIVMTVTGTLKNANRVLFSPASTLDWPAAAFELRSAEITIDGTPLGTDLLWYLKTTQPQEDFTAVYTFAVTAPTSAPAAVTPRQYTAKGDDPQRNYDQSRLAPAADIPPAEFATDLEITKTGPAKAVAGSSTVYSHVVTVTSTGAFAAEGVTVVDTWPAAFPISSIEPSTGTFTVVGDVITWTIGTLAPDAVATLTVNFTVPKATPLGDYTNSATVTSTTPDPGPDTATFTTEVVAVPLRITKVADKDTIVAGTTGHFFTITVENLSAEFPAESVVVTDAWPESFVREQFQFLGVPAGSITFEDATSFVWTIGTIAAGGTAILEVDYNTPLTEPPGPYTNTATVTSNTQNPGEPTASATVTVEAAMQPFGLLLGTDDGCNEAIVRVIDPLEGTELFAFTPYPGFQGSVRVAAGDVNGDGTWEIIVAPGRALVGEVKIYSFDGSSVTLLSSFRPFGNRYRGGVEIAVADFNNDGNADIATAQSIGKGQVNVFLSIGDGSVSPTPFRSFRGSPKRYGGGVMITAGDFGTYANGQLMSSDRDGIAEVVVGPNAGTAAVVRVFDISPVKPKVVTSFAPFGTKYRGGVTLSTGTFIAGTTLQNTVPQIVVGTGTRGGSLVQVRDGRTGAQVGSTITAFSTFAKPAAAVFAAALDLTGDGLVDDVYGVQGRGGGGGTRGVRRYDIPDDLVFTLQNYAPPLRTAPIQLSVVPPPV